jgi:hypothetical protein
MRLPLLIRTAMYALRGGFLVRPNTGLGEAGAIDPTSKATIRGGKTYEEAIKHAEETLTLYLESYDELGKSIPEERGLKQPTSPG